MKHSSVLVVLSIAAAGGIVGYVLSRPAPPANSPKPQTPVAQATLPTAAISPTREVPAGRHPEPTPPTTQQPPPESVEPPPETPASKGAAKVKKPKREPSDPLSRQALIHVGDSAVATSYWLAAINNKNLPPDERSDLIEDLNEEGFSDPDNPTREDLPLIISRLQLIANYGPYAMDNVNAAAFAEAGKDLLIMYNRLMEP